MIRIINNEFIPLFYEVLGIGKVNFYLPLKIPTQKL